MPELALRAIDEFESTAVGARPARDLGLESRAGPAPTKGRHTFAAACAGPNFFELRNRGKMELSANPEEACISPSVSPEAG